MTLTDSGDIYLYEHRNSTVKKEKSCVKLAILLGVRKMNLTYVNF